MHHLFDVKNCAVIVALNKKAIYANFKTQFGCDGAEYLRKFFTYNFVIQTEYVTLLRNLIKDFIETINNSKAQDKVYTEQDIEYLILAVKGEFERISVARKISYNNRDITNYFKLFNRIWGSLSSEDIVFIGFLLLMVLYKQYEETKFQAFQKGMWENNALELFNFGEHAAIITRIEFFYDLVNTIYPVYSNNFCNNFNSYIDDIYMIKSGATTGKVSIVNTRIPKFTIWSPLAVLRMDKKKGCAKYLFYALQTINFQKQVALNWSYGTQQNLGMRTLEQLILPVPPLEEQQQIADYLDKKCAEIDRLISIKQQKIETLTQYKKSLIYEYVTGKKQVG